MCPITQVDSTFHEKFWNTIFVHCINFDSIKSFWNVITTLLASGELVSRCFTETKSQTPKQAVHVRDWCGSTWVGVFGSGRYRPTLFFRLHHWYLDTAAPQRGRAKCLKMSVHTCVSSLAGSQHPSWDTVWACCFLGVDVLLTSSVDAVRGRWPVVFAAIPRSLNLPGAPLSSDLIAPLGFESRSSCEKLHPTAFLCYLPCYYLAPPWRQQCLND